MKALLGLLLVSLLFGGSWAQDTDYTPCTCELGDDTSGCFPDGHLIKLLDFDSAGGVAHYAVCANYPGGGGDQKIKQFNFYYEKDPPCVSGGSWSVKACKTEYPYSSIDDTAVTDFASCSSGTKTCNDKTEDSNCDLTDVDLFKCNLNVNKGNCVTVEMKFPPGLKKGSQGTWIRDNDGCEQTCSLGPTCIECEDLSTTPPDRDLENPCSEFINGLLPYCYGLNERSDDAACGAPYGTVRSLRNEHYHEAFHTDNSARLRDTPSHQSLRFETNEFEKMDYFNPRYSKGRFQNGLAKRVDIPLTNGEARVDCPHSTTNIRLRFEGLSPNQQIWLAGDGGYGANWHGKLEGPFNSEKIIKTRGLSQSTPGAGVIVVVEGENVEMVSISSVVCLFNNVEKTRKVHNVPSKAVSSPPGYNSLTEELKNSANEKQKAEEAVKKASQKEEVITTNVGDGWGNFEAFGSVSGDPSTGARRGYTPSSDCYCQPGVDQEPCITFCEETDPCTVNMECMRDNQLVFPREVPEQAVAVLYFLSNLDGPGDPVPFICSGGLLGQTLGYPPGESCTSDFTEECPDGYYNNFFNTYFLTAAHCFSDQATAETSEFIFNYSISCEQGITGNCYSSIPEDESGMPDIEEFPPESYNYACAYTTDGADLVISSQDPQFSFIQPSSELIWLPYGDFTILSLTGSLPPQRCYFGYSTINHATLTGEVLYRVGHPNGAPRAYAESQVTDGSDYQGGYEVLVDYPERLGGDYIANLQLDIADVGLSAVGPQGGASGGIVFNKHAQIVGTQSGWEFFWGWVEQDGTNENGISGSILGTDMNPCLPNYVGPEFEADDMKTYRVVNQYIIVDGSFYAYFNSVEDLLQDLCCPPFLPDGDTVGTTKLDFSIETDGSPILPPDPTAESSGYMESQVTSRWVDWFVSIGTQKLDASNPSSWATAHGPQLFNSSFPTTGYEDLGSPNALFNGPGVGDGGSSGPGLNSRRLGWLLAISENENQDFPSDAVNGGAIVFTFGTPGGRGRPAVPEPVPIAYVEILDGELNTVDGFIQATDSEGVVYERPIIAYGKNAYYRADFYVENIVNLTVSFAGSGSVASIVFCDVNAPVQNAIGDRVWFDQNANGIQEVYETTGISGVVVQLHSNEIGSDTNQRLAETLTNEDGWYEFTSLADGEYIVTFELDDSNPFFDAFKFNDNFEGWSWSPPNQGSDIAKDSNAISLLTDINTNRAKTSVITVTGGTVDYTWDAGIIVEAKADVCVPYEEATRNVARNPRNVKENSKARMAYQPKKSQN